MSRVSINGGGPACTPRWKQEELVLVAMASLDLHTTTTDGRISMTRLRLHTTMEVGSDASLGLTKFTHKCINGKP